MLIQKLNTSVKEMERERERKTVGRQTGKWQMRQKGAADLPRARCGTDGGECR